MKTADAIDVICQCSKDGSVIPMRIRVQDDEGVFHVYTIKKFTEISSDKVQLPNEVFVVADTIRFDCEIVVFNMTKKIRLHFKKSHAKWYLYF